MLINVTVGTGCQFLYGFRDARNGVGRKLAENVNSLIRQMYGTKSQVICKTILEKGGVS